MTHCALIVCGSRHWTDVDTVEFLLDELLGSVVYVTLITGGAPGADSIAYKWAQGRRNVRSLSIPAFWTAQGKAAGPYRNEEMLCLLQAVKSTHHLVAAFKNDFGPRMLSGGTEDMVRRSKDAGIPVTVRSTERELFQWNYPDREDVDSTSPSSPGS